jgi:hypothetical protein
MTKSLADRTLFGNLQQPKLLLLGQIAFDVDGPLELVECASIVDSGKLEVFNANSSLAQLQVMLLGVHADGHDRASAERGHQELVG